MSSNVKKRPDVAKRKTETKDLSFVSIKTTLNSITRFPKFKNLLEDVIYNSNQALEEAYIFANFHTTRCVQNSVNLIYPNQDFYYKCLSIVSEGIKERSEIEDLMLKQSSIEYKNLRGDIIPADSSYISLGIFQNLSLQMATNASNFLSTRFLKIFSSYLRHKYSLEYYQASKIITNILLNKPFDPKNIKNPITQYYSDFINKFDIIEDTKDTKDTGKVNKYETVIIKWQNEIAILEMKQPTDLIQLKISELNVKIENAAVYCRRYLLLTNSKATILLLYKILKYNEKIQLDAKNIRNILEKHNKKLIMLSPKDISQLKLKLTNYDLKKVRLFSILPTKSNFTINHIKICKTGLYSILNRGLNMKDHVLLEDKNDRINNLKETRDNDIQDLKNRDIKPKEKADLMRALKLRYKEDLLLLNEIVIPFKFREDTVNMMTIINQEFKDDLLVLECSNNKDLQEITDLKKFLNDIPKDKLLCSDSKYADRYFTKVFKFDNILRKNKKKSFYDEVQTDGKAASITVSKLKMNTEILDQDYIISKILEDPAYLDYCSAVDPGYTNPVTMIKMLDKSNSYTFTNKSYYHDSNYTSSNKIIKTRTSGNPEILKIITDMPTNKTTDLTNYITYMIPKLKTLMNFYGLMKIRDLKFRRYCCSRKTIDRITNNMTKDFGRKTVIGFGDFSNNGCLQAVKGPVKIIEKSLRKKCIVLSIDEFRTSKLSHEHQIPMEHRHSHSKDKNDAITNQKIYTVLYCNNNSKNCTTINRDVNASQNILEILIHLLQTSERHPAFDRTRDLEEPFVKVPTHYNFRYSPAGGRRNL